EHGGCEDIGFIAEEVGEIIPEAVSWDGEFADSLDTKPIIAYLTRAVQCQQDEIEIMEKKLDELFEEIVEEEKTEEESAGLDE
ncbi:MAG: hypothetical protein JW869_03975, partial [Candidatus Omnitrophica bacterium]|nr:hypothetical protein [Candidatus Omnitrophota bacterium]